MMLLFTTLIVITFIEGKGQYISWSINTAIFLIELVNSLIIA